MQQRSSLEEYIESLMYEESLNDLITILSDTIDSLPIGDNIAGFSAGLGGGTSNGGGGAECVGSYPVSGYTRSDGTEVSGYIRTCGAAHAGSSNNNQQNTDSENDWDYVNPDDLDDVLDRELLEDYYNNRTPLLEGKVEHDEVSSMKDYLVEMINKIKNVYSKYEGLFPLEAAQKALSKSSIGKTSEKQYYGYSANLADGEAPSDFMKEQNDFYKLKDITDPELRKIYIEKAAKMYGLNPSAPDTYERVKNTVIVMPKQNSQLYNQIKNSETFQKWVAENYEKIKNNETPDETITFPGSLFDSDKRALYATIHRADIKAKVDKDGSMQIKLNDGFDFEKWKLKHYMDAENIKEWPNTLLYNQFTRINNRAFEQQEVKQLERYLLSTTITLDKNELEEILKTYGLHKR